MNPEGIVITHGIKLEDRKQKTITFLATFKSTIELIPPSHTPGAKTPDVIINGVAWEIKCPGGNNYKTIERALHRGVRQSQNIILDLRFMKIPDQKLHQNCHSTFCAFT